MFGLVFLVVLSASMGGVLPVGSLAVAAPQEEYFVGDIVTFKIPNSDELLTHRIVDISPEADASHRYGVNSISDPIRVIRTQGDANNVADDWELTDEDIVGKIIFHLPYLGYLFYLPQTIFYKVLPRR